MRHCDNQRAFLILSMGVASCAALLGDELTVDAVRDNSIYQDFPGNSNGSGSSIFAGNNANGAPRRALVKFDVSALPPDALIESASLQLWMAFTAAGTEPVSLHRLTASWGEAGSMGLGAGGRADTGDATWVDRFFPTVQWAAPGGDFVATASATLPVGAIGFYTWQSDGMIADVVLWRDNAQLNEGWILIGNESSIRTAKRFSSRESELIETRPRLTIVFSLPCPADVTGDGAVNQEDLNMILASFGATLGEPGYNPAADLTGDGVVDQDDLNVLLAAFGTPCP